MVAKMSIDMEDIAKEIKVVRTLQAKKSKNVAKIIDFDILFLNNFEKNKKISCGYFIMPRYEVFPEKACPFTMTRQLITAFEHLHGIGRVHNDLKPSNVLMDKKGSAVLIDYGLCQKFTRTDEKTCFYGNIMFSSKRKLSYKKTSRKDDLLSLAYLLIYLVCNKTLPFADEFYSGDLSDC